jgi:tetratricopeptide (TPR) repeat protein
MQTVLSEVSTMVKGNGFVTSVLCGLILFGHASECFADVAAQLEQAEQYVGGGNYPQAETIYKGVVAADPNTDEAFRAQEELAVLYVLWGKQAKAGTAYQELLARYSARAGIAKAVDRLADVYRKKENFQKGKRIFKRLASVTSISWTIGRMPTMRSKHRPGWCEQAS